MEQYDYETEHSLRIASDANSSMVSEDESRDSNIQKPESGKSVASSPSTSGQPKTNEASGKGEEEAPYPHMTINTRRRLIRKPLPQTPNPKDDAKEATLSNAKVTSAMSTTTAQQVHATGDRDIHQMRHIGITHSAIFSRNQAQNYHPITLEEARNKARNFILKEKAILEWWPDTNHSVKSEQVESSKSSFEKSVLNKRCRKHLERIIEFSIYTSTDLDKAESTLMAQSITSAVLVCLASLTQADALTALQQTSSVMWRVDALVRSNDQLSGAKGGLNTLLGILGVRWPKLASWRAREGGEEVLEGASAPVGRQVNSLADKRSFSSSSSMTIGTEQRRRKRDVAMQLLNNALWTAGVNAGEEGGFTDTEQAVKSTTEEKKKVTGAAPALLSKPAAPIVALTGETSSIELSSSKAERKEGEQMDLQDEETRTNSSDSALSKQSEDRKSLLTDRLAMQLRNATKLQAENGVGISSGAASVSLRKPISRSASHTSLFDKLHHSSSATESDAARVMIAICKVCVRFEDDWNVSTAKLLRSRRRSDTITMKDSQRRMQNSSSISDRSEKTINELIFQRTGIQGGSVAVDWIPNDFDGEPLHLNPLSSDIEGHEQADSNDGVRTIGGTFTLYGIDESFRIAIHNTLDIALYAAITMMLETSFLCDFDLTPKSEEEVDSEEEDRNKVTFADAEENMPTNHDKQTLLGNDTGSEVDSEQTNGNPVQGHWHRNIWSILHMGGGPSTPHSAEPHSNSPGRRSTVHFPRAKTTEPASPSHHRKLPSISHYGRLTRMISSFTGNVNKKSPNHSLADGRIRSFSDVRRSSLPDLPDEFSHSALVSRENNPSTFLDGEAPTSISAYHDYDGPIPGKIVHHNQRQEDLMKELISRQTLSLLMLEGLDVSLPFARQTTLSTKDHKRNLSKPHLDGRKGSTLSIHSDLAPTASRISNFSRTTEITSRSNQKSTATGRKKQEEDRIDLQETVDKKRRDVSFYQRGGNCRDATLGQAVEEMVAKTAVLHKEWLQSEKGAKQEKDTNPPPTFKIAQYLHNRDRITVSASIIKPKEIETASGRVTKPVTEAPTPSLLDAKEIANTLRTDKDLAQTALKLAEHIQNTVHNQAPNNTDKNVQSTTKETSINDEKKSKIEMWHADMRTGRQTVKKLMSDATYLLSYGTFLSDLMTSPFFVCESPMLHGVNEGDKELLDASDDPKHDLVRLFKIENVILKFHVQTIPVYDLLIDGPVICMNSTKCLGDLEATLTEKHEDRDTLTKSLITETRTEIRDFFASVKDEASRMEQMFVARELDINGNTMKPPPPGRDSVRSIFTVQDGGDEEHSERNSIAPSGISSYSGAAGEPLELLAKLMANMRKSEFKLYEALKEADISSLNDVRRQFLDRAKSSKNRLIAWSKKHLSKAESEQLRGLKFDEPYYFERGNYAFPGSRFILRQDEPLSIIAYSLSSRDFNEEIEMTKTLQKKHFDVLNWRSSVAMGEGKDGTSSLFSSTTADTASSSMSSSRSTDQLDPDEDAEFHVPEPLRVNMKRKKRTKDVGILSLRIRSSNHSIAQEDRDDGSLLSQSIIESDPGEKGAEKLNDDASTPTASRIVSSAYAPSSTRFDTVSSNNDAFRAHVSTISPRGLLGDLFTPGREKFDDHLEGLVPPSEDGQEAASLLSSSVSSHSSGTEREGRLLETPKMRNGSRMHSHDDGTGLSVKNETEEKTDSYKPSKKEQLVPKPRIAPVNQPASPHIKHTILSGDLKISCVSWFAEDFHKLRKTWKIEEDFINSLSRSRSWNNVGGKSKSGFLLTGDGKWIAKQLLNVWTVDEKEAFLEFAPAYLRYMMNSVVNDCPTLLVKIAGVYSLKIKDVKTGEVKLKLSVQVLENVFAGDHGQSIRFDLKGIKDRRVSNTAIQKMQSTTNVQASQPQQKTTITTTEKDTDLTSKAIEEEGTNKASVWWDGEWIDTMLPRAFVPEQHKIRFQRALRNDMAFLTASNVMDYSLLVGVNEPIRGSSSTVSGRKSNKKNETFGGGLMKESLNETGDHHIFRVRIVDFLGAWTLVKQLESSGKKAIKSQTPTIIPPQDYASRFSQAIESYFIGCPAPAMDE